MVNTTRRGQGLNTTREEAQGTLVPWHAIDRFPIKIARADLAVLVNLAVLLALAGPVTVAQSLRFLVEIFNTNAEETAIKVLTPCNVQRDGIACALVLLKRDLS